MKRDIKLPPWIRLVFLPLSVFSASLITINLYVNTDKQKENAEINQSSNSNTISEEQNPQPQNNYPMTSKGRNMEDQRSFKTNDMQPTKPEVNLKLTEKENFEIKKESSVNEWPINPLVSIEEAISDKNTWDYEYMDHLIKEYFQDKTVEVSILKDGKFDNGTRNIEEYLYFLVRSKDRIRKISVTNIQYDDFTKIIGATISEYR